MPRYCYYCPECEERKTINAPYDHDNPTCECDGEEHEMKRDYKAEGIAGIHFKGKGNNTGFHDVDYD